MGTVRVGNRRTSQDYPDFSIVRISQKTEKSLGDSDSSEIPQRSADVKNSPGVK